MGNEGLENLQFAFLIDWDSQH